MAASYDRYLDREIARATDGEAPPPERHAVAVIDWGRNLLAECAITADGVEVDRIDRISVATREDVGAIPPADWAREGIDALALSDLRALARETWEGMHS